MPGDRCVVAGCRNKRAETRNSTEDRVVYHRFPTDEGMYKQWIQRCRRSDKINYRYASVCSDHFTDEDYKRDLKAELLKITPKRLLKPGAVPSLNLMAPIEENPLQAIHNDRKIQRRENKKLVNERLNVDPSICRGENVAQDKTGITLRVATTTDPVKHEYEKLEDNLASIQHGDVVNVSSSEREDKVSAETNISPEGYKRRQESKASSTRAKSSVGAERPQGGIYVIVHRIIQSKRKEDPYGNEVESKKRKTTKRAHKKGRGKKRTVAATVGDGGGKPDEEKEEDCDESIDIEESDVYIKQEALEPEIIDDIKPPVITVSSLNSCEPETIVPEIIPVVIKTEPMEEEEETTSAAVDDTSKDDEESKGWKCTSLGCHRIFRNKDKMELHAKRKHALDDKVNAGNLVTIKEEDQNSTFGLLSLETFPTPVVSTNAVTTANWSVLPTHNSPPGLTSTKVITAPINSQTGDPSGTRKYLVMIPTQSPATVGGVTGVRPPQPSLLPVLVPSPTPSLSPSPTSPQVTPPLKTPSADSSETLTIDLSHFDERTRVGLKKKILELLDVVEKRKLNPDNLAIVYYNSDKNRSEPDEESDSDVEAPSAKKRKSTKTARKEFQKP